MAAGRHCLDEFVNFEQGYTYTMNFGDQPI